METIRYTPFFPFTAGSFMLFMQGCCNPSGHYCPVDGIGEGGGQDNMTISMPFDVDYTARCVQGVGGSYSHHYTSTYYDLDFDTPNDVRDLVYAPVDGTAYVHDDDRDNGFGVHINIDMGDGTYVLIGHLDDTFVDDGSEVAAGEMLGFEGTTGNSTGDHVHIGRHDGDATKDATTGESIEGLVLSVTDDTTGVTTETSVSDFTCGLSGGHAYTSLLPTPHWHPNGTLVKTPDESTVYLLEDGAARAFWDEDAFWSRGYDFDEVALVSDAELDCMAIGANITGQNDITALYDGTNIWLVSPGDHSKQKVAATGWQAVLKSWGIMASSYDDLGWSSTYTDWGTHTTVPGTVPFRDGSLISEVSDSAVYVIGDGIAMPIEDWDVFLLMGFATHTVIEVDDGVVDAVMSAVGDCATNAYCVSAEDVTTCGGPPADDEATYTEHEDDTSTDATGDTGTYADEGGGVDTASTAGLSVTWTTPTGFAADTITLSGEYTHASGWSEGWQTLMSVNDLASVTYEVVDALPGDTLRFSVEYTQGGVTSWSCLSPFPPGTVEGSAAASYRGVAQSVTPSDDPASDGCGLLVTVS